MTDHKAISEKFDALSNQAAERIPDVAEIWFRPESECVVDLRLRLQHDTWAARERAIDAMVELRAEMFDADVSINYSFVLPDAAFDPDRESAPSHARVHAFA